MLVAGFIEIKNARVKKFSNIRENLLHISSGMQVLIALVLIEIAIKKILSEKKYTIQK